MSARWVIEISAAFGFDLNVSPELRRKYQGEPPGTRNARQAATMNLVPIRDVMVEGLKCLLPSAGGCIRGLRGNQVENAALGTAKSWCQAHSPQYRSVDHEKYPSGTSR
jgi:hypothetical protein